MEFDTQAVIAAHPLFEFVPADKIAGILAQPECVQLPAGYLLFQQGAPADLMYVLVDGLVDLTTERPGMPIEVLARLGPGECVGVNTLMPGGVHIATARAVSAVSAALVSGAKFCRLMEDDFPLTLSLIAAMAGSLRGQVKEITELKLQSTTERLASYLVSLAGNGDGRTTVRLPFEKRQLADRLGMEPATLSRAFAKLREAGVETGRGDKVEIADLGVLRAMSEAQETMSEWEST